MPASLEERAERANHVIRVGMVFNALLIAVKLAGGILGSSQAVLADAVNSLSDFATDIVALLGFRVACKPADQSHQYGHGKFETLVSVIIGLGVLLVGLGILWGGAVNIYRFLEGEPISRPGVVAIAATVVSIAVKEGLYRYTSRAGRTIQSRAVIAKAWDHRSDALSSGAVLLGIGGAVLLGSGWSVLDPIAAVAVSIFIIRVAFKIAHESVSDLLEASLGENAARDIRGAARDVPGVLDAHAIKTRRVGNSVAVDLHIEVDRALTIAEAHDIASEVETRLRAVYGPETMINVHMEPR